MMVVALPQGFAVMFTSKKHLEGVIEQLQGQLRHIEEQGVEPPHIYCLYDSEVSELKMDRVTDALKGIDIARIVIAANTGDPQEEEPTQ